MTVERLARTFLKDKMGAMYLLRASHIVQYSSVEAAAATSFFASFLEYSSLRDVDCSQ